MFSFENYIDLQFIWAGLIATAVLLYVLLDGFDLGVGILFPFAPSHKCRNKMINSIAPFWDGNETWLVLGGGGLFAAFPLAYAIIMPALYIPVISMLLGLIFRGVSLEFRYKADTSKYLWDFGFHFGSLLAAFMQGVILGGLVQGIEVDGRNFAGGAFDWLSGFSIMCGVGVICGYVLLGATWTILKTEDNTQVWARGVAKYISIFVLIFMGLVSLWVPYLENDLHTRWFGESFYWLLPIPMITAIIFFTLFASLQRERELVPFICANLVFVMGFIGLGVSLFPYFVPYEVTIYEAAAAPEGLSLMLVGVVLVLPIILGYTAYCYYLFRGKSPDEAHY
ncbi:MAG: cytochrome d ubiquinol oxidase subunit II [Micavibrio sp.]|nr:cytochrome d ubiquinol oxidase subunit II [Micavibrio sp.]